MARDVRSELEKHLRRHLDDEVWEFLVRRHYVGELVQDDQPIGWLAGQLEELESVFTRGHAYPNTRSARLEVPDASGRPGSAHQWALSVVVAAYAREDPEVKSFRRDVLGDKLLDWADLPAWMDAQAAKAPLRRHVTATIDGALPESITVEIPSARLGVESKVLRYTARGDETVLIQPITAGTLDLLHHIVEHLARAFSWEIWATTVFVLSDVVPYIAPVTATIGRETIRFGRSLEWSRRITLASLTFQACCR